MIKKNKISSDDKKDWEDFLKDPNIVIDEKENLQSKNIKSQFTFDLHGYSIEAANKKVIEIIENCYSRGILRILLITGQGHHSKVEDNVYVSKDHSTLSGTIPEFIQNNADISSKIISLNTASEKKGGKGALIIKLKKIKV